jgi:hypothetical protein
VPQGSAHGEAVEDHQHRKERQRICSALCEETCKTMSVNHLCLCSSFVECRSWSSESKRKAVTMKGRNERIDKLGRAMNAEPGRQECLLKLQ